MITTAMWSKAQACIAADSEAAYKATGNHPGRKHKPYSIPERARELVRALGTGDAELVASVMLYQYSLTGRSDPLGL